MDKNAPTTDYAELITKAESEFEKYHAKCDNIEKVYADLADMTKVGDRQMRIFWANMEVLRPIIYSRPPRPLVVTRHKDRKRVPNKAGEILQRVLEYGVESNSLHSTLKHTRDDLALNGRGVVWVADDGSIEHVDRVDFLHDKARKWSEVTWVARRAWYTPEDGVERFGDAFKQLSTGGSLKDDDSFSDNKVGVWEIWNKTEREVAFLADSDGVQELLEFGEPLFEVDGFFPCPCPAYATTEPRTLNPVPDIVFYKDQLDEINQLTARISALSDSLRLKGFYPSGVSEVGEAVEAAFRRTDNEAILIPVANLASLGGQNLSQSIVWMPVREVAQTITDLIGLRRQLIQDVYEITGLSDIMRGSTMASETATAQNLKAQYGSVRVRERQSEMVRIARDALALQAEIIAESVPIAELLEIAQMDDIPTLEEVQQGIAQQQQVAAQQAAMAAQAAMQQGKQPAPIPPMPPMPDLSDEPMHETIEALFRSQKIRPFILSVETDSTIQPNEEADKASRMEFVNTMSQFLQQAVPAVMQAPVMAPMLIELMKFSANGFRAGRELSDVIDNFGDQINEMAEQVQQPKPPQVDPKDQMELQKAQQDAQIAQAELQLKVQESQVATEKAQAEIAKLLAEVERIKAETAPPVIPADIGITGGEV